MASVESTPLSQSKTRYLRHRIDSYHGYLRKASSPANRDLEMQLFEAEDELNEFERTGIIASHPVSYAAKAIAHTGTNWMCLVAGGG